MITADGCWTDYRTAAAACEGRACLFLDRDGVLIEDTGYPHEAERVALIPEILELVRIANEAGLVVGIVSNQSGIGRGLFPWRAFAAVQDRIDGALAACGGRLDFVLACPHHPDAVAPIHRHADHPWRKPAPGMLRAAADTLRLDLAASIMVGDRATDMAAARAAGLARRLLLDGAPQQPGGDAWAAVGRESAVAWLEAELDGRSAQR